jgi:hypothetical protein
MFKLFGREQVVYLAVIAAAFGVLTSYGFDVDHKLQGILTAIVVFVFAVGNAVRMHDGAVALATGIFNAAVALFLAFNVHMSADQQALWTGLATVLIGAFTRQNVINPIPAGVSPAGKLVEPAAPAA